MKKKLEPEVRLFIFFNLLLSLRVEEKNILGRGYMCAVRLIHYVQYMV